MKKLTDLDAEFRASIASTAKALVSTSNKILKDYQFDLSTTEISEAILERLKVFYLTQQEIKQFLNKRYQTAGADFFVESVLSFLKMYLDQIGSHLEVHSERQVKQEKRAIRPDISIWKGDEVVAIIECKTQLGWNRNNWESDFKLREQKLQQDFPKARAYLLVMTGRNWGGFDKTSLLAKKYFCLLDDIWPPEYQNPNQLLTPIENLFKELTAR